MSKEHGDQPTLIIIRDLSAKLNEATWVEVDGPFAEKLPAGSMPHVQSDARV